MNSITLHGRAVEITGNPETHLPDQNQSAVQEPDTQGNHQFLVEWNQTSSEFPRDRCVHDLFAEQTRRRPAAVAVVAGDKCLTYAELDARSNQIAHYLRTVGVGPEVVVAVCIDRSMELIIGLLAILKAGGAYLPLDRNDPSDHLAYLMEDAGARVVITSVETDRVLASHNVPKITLDLNSSFFAGQPQTAPLAGVSPDNLAYVMYTSGSSGKPKGVGVTHCNIIRLVRNTNYVQIKSDDVFLQLAPVTFDAATFEIWGALLNGANLTLYPPDPMLDLVKLKNLIHKIGVSVLWLTSGLFNSVVDADVFTLAPVRQLLVGGDVVSAIHVRRVMEQVSGCRVINGYGPTEGTTFSVCFPIPDLAAIERMVPIGRPVSNTTVYVLDPEFKPVPVGASGELYIGGQGLARGYFRRPDLTAASFLPDPFGSSGARLYRTGDVVRYSSDGILEFVGRVDFQVKVRGYRIELEEVEAALLSNSNIRQAAVIAQPDPRGDRRLAAYVVGSDGVIPDIATLRAHMSSRLPEYMVPSVFVVLDALPLTANGKVDRRALLSSEQLPVCSLPGDGVEGTVAEIFASALGMKEVGLDDDFFELGGTSLALINAVVEMGKRLAIPLDTGIVAGGATVRALAQAVKERMPEEKQSEVESTVAEIFASALGMKEVRLDDDFFELGGTSLALINVVVEMGKRLAVPLDTGIVAGGATVRALAQAVKERTSVVIESSLPLECFAAQ